MKNIKNQQVKESLLVNKIVFIACKIVDAVRGFFQQIFETECAGVLGDQEEEKTDTYCPLLTTKDDGSTYGGGWDWLVRLKIVEPDALEFKFICEWFQPVPLQFFKIRPGEMVIAPLHALELFMKLVKMGLMIPASKIVESNKK